MSRFSHEPLRLLQCLTTDGSRAVAAAQGASAWIVPDVRSTLDLARLAIANGQTLTDEILARGRGKVIDLVEVVAEKRLLLPIDHPDPAHILVSGTGLTHLGSAEGRDRMHQAAAQVDHITDSMRMFLDGVADGKPDSAEIGAQPEWFYKGDGQILVASGEPLISPAFARDGGEEPELAGIYLIGPDGAPYRLGYCLGNEFSDHVTERHNYLWLAHSKLRLASLSYELIVGELPRHFTGRVRIHRGSQVLWDTEFVSGEDNMSHSFQNLEHHHFKYSQFRRPGDVHVHFFGTATLSFTAGLVLQDGDVVELSGGHFTLPLINPIQNHHTTVSGLARVRDL